MKSKPISHKCDNTFKFESFNERLNKINVSSVNHLKRRFDSLEDDEDVSFFAVALEKWQDLNCSNHYRELRSKLGSSNEVRNLVQILHRKREIVEILIEELRSPESQALNAVLELIVALARDLQTEFYEFFPEIYQLIVELTCQVNNAESIEQLFVCQTFLFKYLWKPVINDIDDHFKKLQKALTSKKDYVVNFWSETFSFLVRKSKEPKQMFALLFESLPEDSNLAKPVGRILFECIKGVQQAYHSKAKQFLDQIFGFYFSSEHEAAETTFEYFISNLLENSSTGAFKLLYNYLLASSPSSSQASKSVRLLKQITEYKRCHHVNEPAKVFTFIVDCLFQMSHDPLTVQNMLATISNLFTDKHHELSKQVVEQFAERFYSTKSEHLSTDQILTFTRTILDSPIIDKYMNNHLYGYCTEVFQLNQPAHVYLCLEFLAYLILHRKKRPLFGQELYKVGKYPLAFKDCDFIGQQLMNYIRTSTDLKLIWFSLIILPNLSAISNASDMIRLIKEDVVTNVDKYFENDSTLSAHILLETIICLAILKSNSSPITEIETKQIVQLIGKHTSMVGLWQCLDVYQTYNNNHKQDGIVGFDAYLPELYPMLLNNFASPYRVLRIISLHLMTMFDLKLPPCENLDDYNPRNIFQICLDAELVPLDLNSYRERLRHIRQLDMSFVTTQVPLPIAGIEFGAAPIHFLLGTLYENLSLLWKPITEVLSTYAQLAKDKKEFTKIVFDHLEETNKLIAGENICHPLCLFNQQFDLQLYGDLYNLNFKPDFYNHRVWLLKSFELFPDLVEQRNRDFVELFFNYLSDELSTQFIYGVSVRENFKSIQKGEESESMDIDDEDDHEDDTKVLDDTMEKSSKKNKNYLWKTLYQYLQVFSKFKNPKALYREPEMLEMYLNMLLSPNATIQKHALDCLFTYDYEHMRKYKDNFYNLIDDKKFKSEINTFLLSDNVEDNVLIAEHRPKVIPLFFRILYGKMLASSGAKVHGKSKIDFLRSIILKILASFSDSEQIIFLELVFNPFNSLLQVEPEQLLASVEQFVNIEAFVPFRQFLSMINTLEYVMKHFGSKSVTVMRHMFKLLIICSSVVNILLSEQHRAQIKTFMVNALKTFRTNCFKVAGYFMTHFDKYPYRTVEVDQLFSSLISPLLATLPADSFNSPSPLLKLFQVFSENPRYHIFFGKSIDDGEVTPLGNMIQLYCNEKTTMETVNFITNIVENLLTAENLKVVFENAEVTPIEINNSVLTTTTTTSTTDQNVIGSTLLQPYISNILGRIQANYHVNAAKKKGGKFAFTLQEVNVLARLSFFIKGSQDSKTVSTLLLHSISQTQRPEEDKEVFTLKTLNHLAKNLDAADFEEILRLVVPLFSIVDKPLSRRELGEYLVTLSQHQPEFVARAKLIREINTFDVRLSEEPDYNRRIGAFQQILTMLTEPITPLDCDYIQLLLENCAFTINTHDDMSLRELSSGVITKVCQTLSGAKEDMFNRFVMNQVLYRFTSRGLRQEKETVRHEYLDILMGVIKLFPGRHVVIDQLLSLCNDEDEELDFWLNLKHIQLHRRTRALTRLCSDGEKLAAMCGRVFSDFLIPLVNHFISDPSGHYAKNVALTTAAIDSLASYLQHCSWHKFDTTLSHYIQGLLNGKVNTKVAIRVISALLDRFTFLRPEIVRKIEAELNEEYFKSIIFGLDIKKKKPKPMKGKRGKFAKKGKKKHEEEEKEAEIEEEKVVDDEEDEEEPRDDAVPADDMANYRKIYNSLCHKLLPLLHKCLHQKSQIEYEHDSRQEEYPEDEEVARIPIALAVVRLLKHIHFNEQFLQANLSSIFLRICQFLQSRTESIRNTARNTLAQILKVLGARYFKTIFYDMRSLLTRGYQRHIFIYTVHTLLAGLMDQMKCGDLDDCLEDVIEVCHLELFSTLAEEKEISHIVTKTREAKKHKGYDIYEIIAQFVSKASLAKLIEPLQKVLSETSNFKKLKVVDAAFHRIGRGLNQNKELPIDKLVDLLVGIFTTTRPDAVNEEEDGHKIKLLQDKLPKKIDSLVIAPKMLRRSHQTARINRLSNNFILSDFALSCYYHLIKNNRFNKDDESHRTLLDQSLPHLVNFLRSKDSKVVTTTLNCLYTLLIKFPELDSFISVSQSIVDQIFLLLKKYSGMSNDDSQLTVLCFKTIAHFINTRTECQLSNEEIVVLLSYAEKDIDNNSHNSTVYFLLKSIIGRKFVCKQLHLLMERLVVVAITTDIDHVRTHAIELAIKYLTEYPIEPNRLKGKLIKLARQLDYSALHGRLAAIKIFRGVLQYLDADTINPLLTSIFVPIASRLFNEESPECKKLVADVVRQLLAKVSRDDRSEIFKSFIVPWLTSTDMMAQTLASIILSILVGYEKADFEPRLVECLPFIRQQLDPARFTTLHSASNGTGGDEDEDATTSKGLVKSEDMLIFNHLTFFLSFLSMPNSFELLTKVKYYEDINQIVSYLTTTYLMHPHTWIRHLAMQIFGKIFSLFQPESFVHDTDLYRNFCLFQEPKEKMKKLCIKFCLVLRDLYNCNSCASQLAKNLVYMAKVFVVFKFEGGDGDKAEGEGGDAEDEDEEQENVKAKSCLTWLIRKMIFEIKFEIKDYPTVYKKRSLIFKWIAAVAIELGKERVSHYLTSLLMPLYRQDLITSNTTTNGENQQEFDELTNLNKEILQAFSKLVGTEVFTHHLGVVRKVLLEKRLENRKQRAIQMITRTEDGVKRKLRKHKRSQEASKLKKRRMK